MKRLVAVVLLAGCVPTTYAFTPAGRYTTNPKPESCAFEVYQSQPADNYEEVGTLEHYNGEVPKDLEAFRKAVAKQVCQAGGDGVIALANESGRYSRGTVIKNRGPMATPLKPVETPTQQPDTEAPNP